MLQKCWKRSLSYHELCSRPPRFRFFLKALAVEGCAPWAPPSCERPSAVLSPSESVLFWICDRKAGELGGRQERWVTPQWSADFTHEISNLKAENCHRAGRGETSSTDNGNINWKDFFLKVDYIYFNIKAFKIFMPHSPVTLFMRCSPERIIWSMGRHSCRTP